MTEPEIRFSERLSQRSFRRAAVLVGASLAIVVGAAVTMGASPSADPSSPGATAQPQASGNPANPDTGPSKGERGDRDGARAGIGFRAIRITSINGSNLALETEDGWTRTITVTSATTITKDGQTAALGDLAVGDQVRLRQTRGADGTFTISAIQVVQPKVAGTVTAVTADSITITARDGSSRTITTTSATTYRLGEAAATRADVAVGATIVAGGTAGSGTSFTATSVTLRAPRVGGTVSAVSGSTITIQRRDGTSATIDVDANTTFQVRGVTVAGLDDVKVGMHLIAVGRLAADGSLDASRVLAGDTPFHGEPRGDKNGQPAPSGSPAASSSTG